MHTTRLMLRLDMGSSEHLDMQLEEAMAKKSAASPCEGLAGLRCSQDSSSLCVKQPGNGIIGKLSSDGDKAHHMATCEGPSEETEERTRAAQVDSAKEPNRSAPMPAMSPTLSPTLSVHNSCVRQRSDIQWSAWRLQQRCSCIAGAVVTCLFRNARHQSDKGGGARQLVELEA